MVIADRERTNGLLALVAVQLCFGLFPPFAKWAFEGDAFSPASVAAYRIVAGIVVLGSFAVLMYGRRALPRGADVLRLFLCAMFGVVVNQGLFLEGVSRTTAINTGLIICLIPVFTYVMAILAGQERLKAKRCLGIGVALLATTMLFLERGDGQVGGHLLGNLLLLLNVASYSLYLVISKPLTTRYPPLVIIAWVYAFSALSLPYFVWGERLVPALAGAERAWWSLGFILLFPTVLGYLLNIFALARVPASTTALFTYLQPVMTGAAGIVLLSESLTAGAVIAAAGLFLGLWLARTA
ncbi:MAG: DMT family transporter [Planctomycetota bacterium]